MKKIIYIIEINVRNNDRNHANSAHISSKLLRLMVINVTKNTKEEELK